MLAWLFGDSGITGPAAALPFVLPLAAEIRSSVPRDGAPADSSEREIAASTI